MSLASLIGNLGLEFVIDAVHQTNTVDMEVQIPLPDHTQLSSDTIESIGTSGLQASGSGQPVASGILNDTGLKSVTNQRRIHNIGCEVCGKTFKVGNGL